MLLDEPLTVVAGSEGLKGLVELVDVVEGLEPEELLLKVRTKRSATPLFSGSAMNAAVERIPRKESSRRKSLLMN